MPLTPPDLSPLLLLQPLTTLRILDVHGIAEAEGEVAAAESAAAVAAQ
jgi:hypothetical protein